LLSEFSDNSIFMNFKKIPSVFTLLIVIITLLASCKPEPDPKAELMVKINETFNSCGGNYALVFEDLNDGDTININPTKKYHAASTMKVPVMIEVMKHAQEGIFSLSDSIDIINEFKSIVDGSPYQLSTDDDSDQDIYGKIGQRSTIFDLVYDMITVSSNLATNILVELVDGKRVTQTMRDLGANDILVLRGVEDNLAYQQGLSNSTTAKDLAIIFKAIETNKAGTADDCQSMIEILKDQKFNEIIPALLPTDVEVAHKTGVITALHHDAGIIYLPNGQKYVLVLLSEELEDFDRCTEMMAKVSALIYDYVQAKNPQSAELSAL
jgi:beta-lactamase class A